MSPESRATSQQGQPADKRTQALRHLELASPLGDGVLLLRRVSGHEELGRLFHYELDLLSENPEVQFDGIVGGNVTIRIETGRGEPRYINGIVSSFAQRQHTTRLARYEAEVVPWLWLLTRTSDCRIFQDKTVPEIIKEIFRDHGLTGFEDRLADTYRTWEYCVQYCETDFEFVSRLMEQEGIYYFFQHENGKHTLVLCDNMGAHQPCPGYETIAYRPPAEATTDTEHIRDWVARMRVQPGGVVLDDFNFKTPKKDLQAALQVSREHEASDFEVYDYPGEYREFEQAERCVRLRLQEFAVRHEMVGGSGDARGICPGHTFELVDHPRRDQCREYLVVSSTLTAASDAYDSRAGVTTDEPAFTCDFMAIEAAPGAPFRPERTTPRPFIRGPQTAIVVGPEGDEIHTDEFGRVKVQFHWDRRSQGDQTSSCWIRVAQGWAGKRWGAMFLPRVGQEVIVEFLEGDPDRPIITGRVYNGDSMPPYLLPKFKTLSTVKSNSSKGGQGFNEIRFEDQKGEEQIFIHAEKNQDIRVKNNCYETIVNDRHLIVKKDQLDHVESNRHELVDMDHLEEIGKDRHLKVKGKQAIHVVGSYSLTVGGNGVEVFKMDHREQTTQNSHIEAMAFRVEAKQGIELKCGGTSIILTPSAIFITGGPMVNINSGSGPPVAPCTATAESPTAPKEAEPADTAEPGESAEVKARRHEEEPVEPGSTEVGAFEEEEEEAEDETHWIGIELVDEDGHPVPDEPYRLRVADGTIREGRLDSQGKARIVGIPPGQCQVNFPRIDRDEWRPA